MYNMDAIHTIQSCLTNQILNDLHGKKKRHIVPLYSIVLSPADLCQLSNIYGLNFHVIDNKLIIEDLRHQFVRLVAA